MKLEKYSVLMSLYIKEKPEYLQSALESMLNQTVKPDEIVIVKDGKVTPELDAVVLEYSEKCPDIFLITGYEQNHGLAYALNYGLNHCKNEMIARMDSDDYSLPQRCETQLKEFEKRPELSLVGSAIYKFAEEMEKTPDAVMSFPIGMDAIKKTIRQNSAFAHPAIMLRKSAVLNCGGYDPEMRRSQDHDLFTRMISMGCEVDNIAEPLLFFRADENGRLRNRNKESCKARIEIQKRLLKRKQCSWVDYLYICLGVTIARIVPDKVFLAIYSFMKERR